MRNFGEQNKNFFIGSVIHLASKRIYQIAKEFEREEKEIIEFLTAQGIKVGNRLSAVSEEAYNMLKAKYTAPPPEPEPEPKPAPKPKPKPKAESKPESKPAPAAQTPSAEQPQAPTKKKKNKKKKNKQAEDGTQIIEFSDEELAAIQPAEGSQFNRATQSALLEGMLAGNEFIEHYSDGLTKKQRKANKPHLSPKMGTWAILQNFDHEEPNSSPARYWNAIARLTTMAFRLNDSFGISNRTILAEMRNTVNTVGAKYSPREIFTDEENDLFAAQQNFLFKLFGSGMGAVNDRLFELKMYAERMKAKSEFADLVSYATNPNDELRNSERPPFNEVLDLIRNEIRGIARRFIFYRNNKERVDNIIKSFFEWLDGYAKLKEQGAESAKLEKYLALEKKFIDLAEFMSWDNLLFANKKHSAPFDTVINLLNGYRDTLDDPDAERNFKYKVRGVTQIIYKPKEFVFLYRLAELEPQVDYRPPEEIAAAEAAKVAETAEATETTETAETAETAEAKETATEE